jgi:PAS domain S-box-containing protein
MNIFDRIPYIPPVVARIVGIVAVLIVGVVDRVTGPTFAVTLFYLVPISFVTWYGGLRYGVLCSLLSMGLALWADVSWWFDLSATVQTWNLLTRLINFAGVAVLVNYIHQIYFIRLKRAEDKYTRIVESTIEGIVATDLEGTIQFVNARASDMLGHSQDSMLGRKVLEMGIGASSRRGLQTLLGNVAGKTQGPFEIQFERADARPMWAWVNSHVSKSRQGNVDGMVFLVLDISERKEAEKALRESEQDYRTLVERMKEGLLRVDNADRIQFLNDAFCDMVGYSREELIGKVSSDILLKTEGKALIEQKQRLRQQGMADTYEVQLRRKPGDFIWVRISGAPVIDASGRVVGSIGVHTDITAQKQADEELRRRYREISAMQQLSSVLVQSMDINERLEAALETVLDLMKLDGGTIFLFDEGGRDLILRHHRGLNEEVTRRTRHWPVESGLIGEVARTGVPAFVKDARLDERIDAEIREKAGIIAIADVPLKSKGKVLGVMTLFLDRPYSFSGDEQTMMETFGKQIGIALENARLYETAEDRARQVRRLSIELVKVQEDERKRFARELHDGLSQVLTTMKINAELAATNFHSNPSDAEHHLREALTLADEAQNEAKQLAYDLRPAILDDFGLKAAVAVLTSNFERRTGVSVEFIAPAFASRFDSLLETSVYRIVQELLANVAKHSAATRVSVQLLMRENTLVLEVADNGKGLESAKGQLSVSTTHFGLRNIRERVEFFGGSFRIESLEGRGTEVMIEVPVAGLLQTQQQAVSV